MVANKLTAAGFLVFGLAFAIAAPSAASAPTPMESPDGDDDECYEWKYPKATACGKLSGKTECKKRPSIEASDDDEKKENCKPDKGDTCFCD